MAKLIFPPPHRLHSFNRAALAAAHLAFSSSLHFQRPSPPPSPFLVFLRSSPSSFARSSGRRRVPSSLVPASSFSSSSSVDEAKGGGDDAPVPKSSSNSSSEDGDGTASIGDGSVCADAGKVGVDIEKGKGGPAGEQEFPSGEFEIVEFDWWRRFVVRIRMMFALPWERVRKGSVLSMKLRGNIADQLRNSFSSSLSLPQICDNFTKAAYDPRVSGIYLQIEPLSCGWGKVEEIRRHMLNFRKSGKFIVSYLPICGEKEYYLACACEELYLPPSAYVALYGLTVQASFLRGIFDKVGVEPQIERIGRYKSAGDQLACKSMSKENCEMLTTLLDNIHGNWLDIISSAQGKRREETENFLNSGVYQVERLKEEGWITNILYDDEIISMLKERLGQEKEKNLRVVDFRRYSRVRKWTLGLEESGDEIAVIRASGSISRARGPFNMRGSGIIGEDLIEKIRSARESKKYKAVIIRIDSPGGDALASDLIWREIRLLAAAKPVVASMSDVAASGGYYMAMGAGAIVAEKLTLTGSIGVVTGKFSLQKLYEKIGFNKEIISRGKYAELNVAEQRPFRPDEAELFAKAAQDAYVRFRDKAAFSRSMTVDQMEMSAQGRVWSGEDAASRGLVDAIGGFSRAVAIAKQRAKVPQDRQVKLIEMSKPSLSLPEILIGLGETLFGLEETVKEVLHELTSSGVQARVDGILFERMGHSSLGTPVLGLIKDCLSSL
uniref:Protease 4 n=1 Tax=Anthurium amnicola TaxID=1678845 RepID=A0A1D1Z4I2_9ARAE